MSITSIRTRAVPDLGGVPPSTAVRVNLISGCSSRSRALFSTSCGNIMPSRLSCKLRWKWKLGLIV
uniref:Uncharacterized protein n=2 Tax=Macaca TaxID=9539 RepID=A0A2K6B3D1_MACNE|nr:unnamed protein product [Macaca fascicularis]